jgi:hypothetical protein
MTTDIIIFSGPTITENEIHHFLPKACCHDPVACGDVIRVLRLNPRILIIIDGYFEQTGAVWHKEILMAIEQGVKVYGASSMGALRAAELDAYGMIGFGEIYQKYKMGEIIDDDEVAVTHNTNVVYSKTITALINDRFTLKQAVKEAIISEDQADELLRHLKSQPYYSRSLFVESKKLSLGALLSWLERSYVDQKKQDAIELLKTLSAHDTSAETEQPLRISHTFFSRKIYREIASSPFKKAYPWLPVQEKAFLKNNVGNMQKHFVYLARLLHLLPDLDKNISIKEDCDMPDKIKQILKYYLIYSNEYSRFSGEYLELLTCKKTIKQNNEFKIIVMIAKLTAEIIQVIHFQQVKVSVIYQQAFIDTFRKEHKLFTLNDLDRWMMVNTLTNKEEFHDFINMMTVFYFIIEKNNVDYLGLPTSFDYKCWFEEARLLVLRARPVLWSHLHATMEEH